MLYHHESGYGFCVHEEERGGALDRGTIDYCMTGVYLARPVGAVIDVGAHVGGFTVHAARTASMVIAYEALRDNVLLLGQTIRLNGLGNVEVHWNAVGDGGDKVIYHSTGVSMGSEFLSGTIKELVPGISLSRMLGGLPQIDFMKVDCEGGEYGLFLGQPPELLRRIARMMVEVHGVAGRSPDDLQGTIEAAGFRVDAAGAAAASARMLFCTRKDMP